MADPRPVTVPRAQNCRPLILQPCPVRVPHGAAKELSEQAQKFTGKPGDVAGNRAGHYPEVK